MTTLERPYQEGYRKGYLEAQLEALGTRANIGLAEAQALQRAEEAGQVLSPEQESDFWLGYYHGRYHGRTGDAAPGAKRTGN